MNKYLKPSEVLDTLQKKVDLKSSLKEAKKSKDIDSIDKISKKINNRIILIDLDLSSTKFKKKFLKKR